MCIHTLISFFDFIVMSLQQNTDSHPSVSINVIVFYDVYIDAVSICMSNLMLPDAQLFLHDTMLKAVNVLVEQGAEKYVNSKDHTFVFI